MITCITLRGLRGFHSRVTCSAAHLQRLRPAAACAHAGPLALLQARQASFHLRQLPVLGILLLLDRSGLQAPICIYALHMQPQPLQCLLLIRHMQVQVAQPGWVGGGGGLSGGVHGGMRGGFRCWVGGGMKSDVGWGGGLWLMWCGEAGQGDGQGASGGMHGCELGPTVKQPPQAVGHLYCSRTAERCHAAMRCAVLAVGARCMQMLASCSASTAVGLGLGEEQVQQV